MLPDETTSDTRNIPIALPSLGEEEWQALREPIFSGWLTQGPKVAEFEKAFATRHQVPHAIATTSCTTALHLALSALDVGPGDEVIVPAFTWVATANVVLYCGATPVFADVDPTTYNLDPQSVAAAISTRTKVIIPVHLFGLCADMAGLAEVANGIPMVEDAACAAGAAYGGQPAGSLGEIGCFSFHPRKSITTGEGGMITTSNNDLADRMRTLRNHGASVSEEVRHHGPKPYLLPEFNVLGFNYRMTDLQGAVGLVQLTKLDRFLNERSRWAGYYSEELADIGWLRTPIVPDKFSHGWQSYVCSLDAATAPFPRDEIMDKLQLRGVSTRPGTHAVPSLGLYRNSFGADPNHYPNAQGCAEGTIALPLHNQMSSADYRYVVEAIRQLDRSRKAAA